LDIYDLYRDFTNNDVTFPVTEFQAWIASLHSNNQYYVPIIDSNIYVSNPDNASDAYLPWERVSGRLKTIWTRSMLLTLALSRRTGR
jgi:alpha-glucosidase